LENEHETVLKIFQFRPKAVIITKGENGATLYYKDKNEILDFNLPAEKINVINKVGCGDIFGAVFFYSYLSNRNLFESLRLANLAAAIAVSKDILNNIDALKNND
jgi:sugar/nucleoside kinase (ribokinase family)